ncbi:hypothetical protein B566_EDAN012708 [Ephemera danica]|nr:hypothetical protein B566_EDAN012708 [Ephemera danica]
MTLRSGIALLLVSTALGVYIPPGPKYRCAVDQRPIFPCVCDTGGDDGLRIRCEYTGLAPLATAFANLADPVALLTISNARFTRLFGEALRPLTVTELRIEDCPLVAIESNALLGVNQSIHSLTLKRTRLAVFPGEALALLGDLKSLLVEGHALEAVPAGGLSTPALELMELTDGLLKDIAPDTFAAAKKLKKLDLHGNALSEIKRGAFRGLRDLEIIDLSHNQLAKVDAAALADLPKLSYFNLSHNALTEIPRGGFARNTLLRHLDLSHNQLKKIDANTFRGLRFLRRLFFSDNLIEEVGRGAFTSITRVGTIDLARNLLTRVDFQMFAGLRFAEKLDVSENRITEIQRRAFTDLYLVVVNVSHNALSSIEVGAFENCANMSVLDFSHNALTKIPKNAFDTISYASNFLLEYNSIADFATIPLQNMTGLQKLNASHNQLTSVPRNAFPKLYELHTVDLSHNQITTIANAVFQPLFSLRMLNLSHNMLGKLGSSTLGAVPTVLELDLRHNSLTEIGRGAVARLSSVRRLLLGHNQISRLSFQLPPSLAELSMPHNAIENLASSAEGESVWPSMNALLELDLSDNKLGESLAHDSNAFSNLLTLRTLKLDRNGLTKPPSAALGPLTSLQYLHLTGNNITELPKGAFGRLPIVFELQLAHNGMHNISVRAFEGLLQLLTLNVSHNNITFIPNGAFQSLVSLRTLDLSYNNIEKMDNKTHGLIDDCLSLERVNLSHNNIGFVTRPMFPSSPYIPYKLREVDLSYNTIPVLTGDLTWGTKKVQKLNISHNLINEIRPDVLGNLTSLVELDLSYNELNELPGPTYGPMFSANLTRIHLSHNSLTTLPFADLLRANPQVLDIRSNLLNEFAEELSYLVENGTQLLFAENPLACTCLLRPVVRWLQSRGDFRPWDSVTLKDAGVKLTWYVSTRQDVGDFQIIVRDKDTQDTILEREVPYTARSDTLPPLPRKQNLQLCLLARDSQGNVRVWRDNQCITLDQTSSATTLTITTLFIPVILALSRL